MADRKSKSKKNGNGSNHENEKSKLLKLKERVVQKVQQYMNEDKAKMVIVHKTDGFKVGFGTVRTSRGNLIPCFIVRISGIQRDIAISVRDFVRLIDAVRSASPDLRELFYEIANELSQIRRRVKVEEEEELEEEEEGE